MKKKQTYWDKLQSPKWQKKRLEVLNDRGFECENCGDSDTQLHVHHPTYIKGREPWEYSSDELMSLCDKCHVMAHAEIDLLTEKLNNIKLSSNFNCTSNLEIAGMLDAYSHDGPFDINIPNTC